MADDEKKADEKTGARGVHARIFLLTMLLLFAGTVALLLYTFLKHGAAPS